MPSTHTSIFAAEVASSVQQGVLEKKLPDSVVNFPVNNDNNTVGGFIWVTDDDPRKEAALSTRAWVF